MRKYETREGANPSSDKKKRRVIYHKYGMKLRAVGPGCQPKGYLLFDNENSYWDIFYNDILYYDHKLTDDEVWAYDLEYLGEEIFLK